MRFKATILTSFVFTALSLSAQKIKVLHLKYEKYFSEQNLVVSDTSYVLIQKLCYNKPNTIDEEYCHVLTLTFSDILKAQQSKLIDLTNDTSLIRCTYGFQSIWNWEEKKIKMKGSVKIISWTNEWVELEMDIKAIDLGRDRTYIYNGRRIFSKDENKWTKSSRHSL